MLTCFKKNDTNPADACQICGPSKSDPTSYTQWRPRSGGSCDDGDPCTKDDYCRAGVCQGEDFSDLCPEDGLYCTSRCDGMGGCLAQPVLTPNTCLIDNQCQQPNQRRFVQGQCQTCDPSKSATSWTVLTDVCGIDGKCVENGEKHPDGCAVCDTTKDRLNWTHDGSNTACFIERSCIAANTKDSIGCLICDPTRAKTEWSTVAGAQKMTYDFEGSTTFPSGFSAEPTAPSDNSTPVKWQVRSGGRSVSGTNAIYYGDPTAHNGTGDYNTGLVGNGAKLYLPPIVLPAGKKAALTFKIYMAIEDHERGDLLALELKQGAVLWKKSDVAKDRFFSWAEIRVDLSAYAGQTIEPFFNFHTMDFNNNGTEGIYIDDISVVTDC